MSEIKNDLYNFLIELNEEKETLLKRSMTDLEYRNTVHELIEETIFVATAWKNDIIIGIDGINRKKMAFLGNIWPVANGYTVVKKTYQGRGIGTLLSLEREKGLKKLFIFHESVVKIGNARMIKIDKGLNYKFVYKDNKFVYNLKTYNRILSLFSPFFIILYRVYLHPRHLQEPKT